MSGLYTRILSFITRTIFCTGRGKCLINHQKPAWWFGTDHEEPRACWQLGFKGRITRTSSVESLPHVHSGLAPQVVPADPQSSFSGAWQGPGVQPQTQAAVKTETVPARNQLGFAHCLHLGERVYFLPHVDLLALAFELLLPCE